MCNRAAYKAHIARKRVHITYMRDTQRGVYVVALYVGGVETACATRFTVREAVRTVVARHRCRWEHRQAACQGTL